MTSIAAVMPGRLLVAAALLAAWIGAAALVAAVVAPAAFAVLPTRALAGAMVGRVLPVIFVGGIVAAAAAPRSAGTPRRRSRVCASRCRCWRRSPAPWRQFGVGPRIASLRAEMGPSIEALPTSDPRRAQFGRLHGVSVAFMGLGMLAAGAALVLTAIAATRER
jgi:hypothetical protein